MNLRKKLNESEIQSRLDEGSKKLLGITMTEDYFDKKSFVKIRRQYRKDLVSAWKMGIDTTKYEERWEGGIDNKKIKIESKRNDIQEDLSNTVAEMVKENKSEKFDEYYFNRLQKQYKRQVRVAESYGINTSFHRNTVGGLLR